MSRVLRFRSGRGERSRIRGKFRAVGAGRKRTAPANRLLGFLLSASVFIILATQGCSAKPPAPSSADLSLSVAIERSGNGRVIIAGTAGVPDGTWIYVEVRTGSDGAGGLYAEAFPVRSGVFTAVTPFTMPLTYRVTAVLSPLLNPNLSAALAAAPERPGVMMRRVRESKEILAEAKASFGTAREGEEALRRLADGLGKSLDPLKKDLRALAGEGTTPLSRWFKDFSKHKADAAGEETLVYSVKLAELVDDLGKEMEQLFKRRLEDFEGGDDDAGKGKSVAEIEGLFTKIDKELKALAESAP